MSRKRIKRQDPSVDAPQVARKKDPKRSIARKQTTATNQAQKRFAARNKILVAFAVAMMMIATTAILAQRGKQKTPPPKNHTEEIGNAPEPARDESPESLTSPSLWSKEYIHGPGGRVVATEERLKFTDVDDGSQFREDIYRIAARGVTVGCPAPNFCPDDSVQRQTMAAFIIRALGDFSPPTPPQQRFTDVPPSNIFYGFIDEMAVRHITDGCNLPNNTMYCPVDPVLHEQMAKFIIRARGEPDPPWPTQQRFNDVPINGQNQNPFANFIDRMAVLGIWTGCGNGNYCPTAPVTRRQMAHILVNAFGI